MPNYDLGSAEGRIVIVSDTSGADKAAASMAAVSAEGKTLQGVMGENTRSMSDQEKQAQRTAVTLDDLRARHAGLTERLQEQRDASNALARAQLEYNRGLLEVDRNLDQHKESYNKLAEAQRAKAEADRTVKSAQEAFRQELEFANTSIYKHDATLRNLAKSYKDFGEQIGDEHSGSNSLRSRVRGLSNEWEQLTKRMGATVPIESTSQSLMHLASAFETVRKAATLGLAGGSAAGFAGLLGGGGVEGVTAMVGAMSQMVGVIGLIPAAVGGAGAALGTLAVGLHGVMEAFGAMGDPQKFVESIRTLAPAAQQMMIQLHSFFGSFRGAMDEVQQSLFAPLLQDIQPLVFIYLPMLMHAGQEIANVFGQAGHLFAGWLEAPQTVQQIQVFLQQVASGLQAAMPAVTAFSQAFLTLSTVGGTFFQQLGNSVARVADEFNKFVSNAAKTGELQAFISGGLNAFELLFHNILRVGEGLERIFAIGNAQGGGFLALFKNIGDEFLRWTESAKGQQQIATFFQLIAEAGQTLHPILRELGSSFATIVGTLTRLGIAIGPGLNVFFTALSNSLKTLAPYLLQAAPAFNEFLGALAQIMTVLVNTLGPQLPQFLQNFADAAVRLVGPAGALAGVLATLLSHLTPNEVVALGLLVFAFEHLGKVLPSIYIGLKLLEGAVAILSTPIGIVVAGIGLLAIGLYEAYQHVQWFKDAVDNMWQSLQKGDLGGIGEQIGHIFSHLWDDAEGAGEKIMHNFANGMGKAIHWVEKAAQDAASAITKYLFTSSPAEAGPMSGSGAPDAMGSRVSGGFATGILSGQSDVADASSAVAGAAVSGLTRGTGVPKGGSGGGGIGYEGAGDPRRNVGASRGGGGGGGGTFNGVAAPFGGSGFDSWIAAITQDMSAWSKIFHDGFNIFRNVFNLGLKGIDTFARLWNGGINPLTGPGGFDQGAKPFIPLPTNAGVPGVPQVGPTGIRIGPPTAAERQAGTGPGGGSPNAGRGFAGVSGSVDAASTTANVNLSATGTPDLSTKQGIANYIVSTAKSRGYSDRDAQAILAYAIGESGLDPSVPSHGRNAAEGHPSIGIFQEQPGFFAAGGGTGSRADAKANIDAYFNNLEANRNLPLEGFGVGVGGLATTSIGGPLTGAGQDWNSLMSQARQFMGATTSDTGAGGQISTVPQGGPTSQDNWGYITDQSQLGPALRGGARLAAGGATTILGDFLEWFNQNIEPVTDSGGFRQGTPFDQQIRSNHLSGTALDINPNDFPGFHGGMSSGAGAASHFTPEQIKKIRDRLATYGGAIKWGEDFGVGYADPMHYELASGPGDVTINQVYNRILAQRPGSVPGGGPASGTAGGGGISGVGQAQTGSGLHIPPEWIIPGAALGLYGAYRGARGLGGRVGGFFSDTFGRVNWTNYNLALLRNGGNQTAALNEILGIKEGPVGPATGSEGPGTDINGLYRGLLDRVPVNAGGNLQESLLRYNAFPGPEPLQGPEVPPGWGPIQGPELPPGWDRYNGLSNSFRGLGGVRPGQILGPGPLLQRVTPPTGGDVVPGGGPAAGGDATGGGGIGRFFRVGGRLLGPALAAAGALPWAWGASTNISQNARVAGPATIGDVLAGRTSLGVGGVNVGAGGHTGLTVEDYEEFHQQAPPGTPHRAGGVQSPPPVVNGGSGNPSAIINAPSQPGARVFTGVDPSQLLGPLFPGGPGPTKGLTGLDRFSQELVNRRAALGVNTQTGADSKPVPVDIQRTGGVQVSPRDWSQPLPGTPTTGGGFGGQGGVAHGTIGQPTLPGQGPPVFQFGLPGGAQGGAVGAGFMPGQQGVPGVPQEAAQTSGMSGMQAATQIASSVGNAVDAIFQAIDSTIQSISAAGDLVHKLAVLPKNTEDVVKMIQDVNQFIKTAASIANATSQVLSTAASIASVASAAGPFGGEASGALSGASAIASLVSGALSAVSQGIDLGIEVYHEIGKYVADIAGFTLGGLNTGWLGGNVNMLLNTNTGELYTYNDNNPLNKNTLTPGFSNAYTRTNANQGTTYNETNIYAGPGQSTSQMMSDTMWMVNTGGPQQVSAAGHQ